MLQAIRWLVQCMVAKPQMHPQKIGERSARLRKKTTDHAYTYYQYNRGHQEDPKLAISREWHILYP